MPKRALEETEEGVKEIVQHVLRAIKKQNTGSAAIEELDLPADPLLPPLLPKDFEVERAIDRILGSIIRDGIIECHLPKEGGEIVLYTFEVEYPDALRLSHLAMLKKNIEPIAKIQIENVPGKAGVMRVVMTYTRNAKLAMRFKQEDLWQRKGPVKVTMNEPHPTAGLAEHLNYCIESLLELDHDDQGDMKTPVERELGDGMLLVTFNYNIKSPVRMEQLQRVCSYQVVQDAGLIPHPSKDKLRVILDFVKSV